MMNVNVLLGELIGQVNSLSGFTNFVNINLSDLENIISNEMNKSTNLNKVIKNESSKRGYTE